MARFCTLASSSRGNCSYLSGGGTAVLVDAGISCRAILRSLAELSVEIGKIAGVFITHEHTDHIRGLKNLLKKVAIPVYASAPTLEWLVTQDHIPPGIDLIECSDGTGLTVGALQVSSFGTPHDAVSSIGLRVELPDGRQVGVATDLGHVTDTVHENLRGCDLVLLESNYDPAMLQSGPYPYFLKRRVGGRSGHLSNDDCDDELIRLGRSGTTRFVLGHLSENNNMPGVARQCALAALEMAGMRENQDYILSVAPAREPLPMIVF